MGLLHWIAHLTGNNTGQVVSWTEHGRTMVGFECDGCGQLTGAMSVHESIERDLAAHTAKRRTPDTGDSHE